MNIPSAHELKVLVEGFEMPWVAEQVADRKIPGTIISGAYLAS
jgi:hypothetical protein